MKVDIITRHFIPNYGSILQTYSTQKALEKLGYDSEVINYIKDEETNKKSVATNSNIKQDGLKSKLKRLGYIILQRPNVTKMNKTFEKFREKYLRQTAREYHSSKELKEDLPKADVYCTGSDQVWSTIGTEEYDSTYFLDFVPEGKKCISYAASFGTAQLSKNLDKNLSNLLKKYETILVRENTAEEIIRKKGFNNVKQVVDPTLLLNQDEWSKICEPTKLDGKDYILVYQLHHNKEMEDYVRNLRKHTNLPIYRVHASIYYGLKPGKFIHLPTPGQFVSYIKNAKYIITDSFHGTVFSLIFQKQFIDILPEKTATRIESILKLVGLEDRILRSSTDYSFLQKNINFDKAEKILAKERDNSIQDLKNALVSNKKNINNINKHKVCCGCRCCEQICPEHAITMEENEEGFLEPVVNEEKCISCGLCLKRCPQLQENSKDKLQIESYAAQSKNKEELLKSSSGGIFSVLATRILNKNGVIYGATFKDNLNVEHIEISKIEELDLLRGSKYVQSNTLDTFSRVKDNLEKNKYVLYTGTPCQIAGLKQFLRKDYNNLITIDIVCHGVPSPKLFNKYKQNLEEKQKSKITKFSFRDKTKNGWGLNLKIQYENNKLNNKKHIYDSYYKSFLNGDTYRECCYSCKYANLQRIGDITLADFWGIENIKNDFNIKDGVSAILVNTEKGRKIFNECKEDINYMPVSIESVIKENKNLKMPTEKPRIRKTVYNGIDNKSYKKFEKENLQFKIEIKDVVKQLVPKTLKKKIKAILIRS